MGFIMSSIILDSEQQFPGDLRKVKEGAYVWIPPFCNPPERNIAINKYSGYRIKSALLSDDKTAIDVAVSSSIGTALYTGKPWDDRDKDNRPHNYSPGVADVKLSLGMKIQRKWLRSRPYTNVEFEYIKDNDVILRIPTKDGIKRLSVHDWYTSNKLYYSDYKKAPVCPDTEYSKKEFKRIIAKLKNIYAENEYLVSKLDDLEDRTAEAIFRLISRELSSAKLYGLDTLVEEGIIQDYPCVMHSSDWLEWASYRVRIRDIQCVNINIDTDIDKVVAKLREFGRDVDRDALVKELKKHPYCSKYNYILKDNYSNCYLPVVIVSISVLSALDFMKQITEKGSADVSEL